MKLKKIISAGLSIAILTSQLGSVSVMANDTNITAPLPEQIVTDTTSPTPPLESLPPTQEPVQEPNAPPEEKPSDKETQEPSTLPEEKLSDEETQEPSTPPEEKPSDEETQEPSTTPTQEPSAPPAQESTAPLNEKTLLMSGTLDGDLSSVGGGIVEYYGGSDKRVEVYTQSSSRFYGDFYAPSGIIFRCYGVTEGQVNMADFDAATYSISSTDGTVQNSKTPVGKYNIYCNTSLTQISVDGNIIPVNSGLGYASGEVVINKRAVTISADSKQKTYGDADPILTFTVSSGNIVPGDVIQGTLFREKAGPATEGVGVYDIKSSLSNNNYVITYVPAKLEIVRANLSITASTPLGRNVTLEYGAVVPEVSFTITGLKNNDTVNNTGGGNNLGTVTVTCTAANDSAPGCLSPFGSIAAANANALESSAGASVAPPPGNYPITVSGLGTTLANYNVNYTNGNIQINRRTVMIKANGYTKSYGQPDKELTATATAPNAATPSTPDISDSGAAMFPLKYTLSRAAGETVGNYPISIDVDAATRQYYDVNYTAADVVISAASLIVTTNSSSREYGDANPVFSVSYSGFVNGENESVLGGTLTFSTSAVRESFVGNYPVTPSGLTSDNYTIQFVSNDLVIEKRNVFAYMVATGKQYGQPDGPMSYTLAEEVIDPVNSPLVGTPLRLPGENVGVYKIMANFPNKNYKVKVITADFTITPAPLTATVNDAMRKYGDENPTFSVRYDGFVRDDTSLAVTGTPEFTTIANTKSPVGNYPVAITGGLSAQNYTISFKAGNLSVTQRPITVTLDDKTQIYGEAEQPLTYTLSEPLVDSEGSPMVVTMERKPGTSVGRYPITGTAVNSNYIIKVIDGVYSITAADLIVRVNDVSRVYDNENPDFTVSYEGLQLDDAADSLQGELVFSTDANRLSAVGGYPVNVSGISSDNYTVSFEPGTLTIDQRPLILSAQNKTVIYGQPDQPLTYVLSEELIDADNSPLVGELAREAGRNVDSYAITGIFENNNYDIHFIPGVYKITPAPLTVKVNESNRQYGDENPDFSATGNGFQYEDNLSDLSGELVFTTNAKRTSEVGDYTVSVAGITSKNYTITFEDGILSINPRPITVTADSKKQEYGEKELELTYTLSEKEVDADNNPLVVSLSKPEGKDADIYLISVKVKENKNYIVTPIPGLYIINPAPLVITVVNKEREQGEQNPTFEVTYNGFKNGENESVLDGELSFKTNAENNSGCGFYTVTADGLTSKNYAITYVDGKLTVKAVPALPIPEPAPVEHVKENPKTGVDVSANKNFPFALTFFGLLIGNVLTFVGCKVSRKKHKK